MRIRKGIYSKAQLDIQFHWIFVLIVGAIILSFFVGLAIWYKGIQEQKSAADVVTTLDALFLFAKESPKTARYTDTPEIDLTFTCSAADCTAYGCTSAFSGGGISRATETEVLFTLRHLEGADMITWALEWKLPYKIANFLYLTNDRVRYVLVYDEEHSSLERAVNSLLAENSYLRKETIEIKSADDFSLVDKQDDFVRIVAFLDEGTLSKTSMSAALGERDEKDKHWDVVYIEGTDDYGTVLYEDGTAPYIGLPLLIGALFSADADFYSCNFQKALLQVQLVSAVYLERAKQLDEYFTSTASEQSYCSYYFTGDVQNAIEEIAAAVTAETIDSSALHETVTLLEENNAYAVIKNCPRLY